MSTESSFPSDDEYTQNDTQNDTQDDTRSITFEDDRRKGQPVGVVHLVMGLIFLGVAGVWWLHAAGAVESVELQWLMPLILVVAGAAGVLASLLRSLGNKDRSAG